MAANRKKSDPWNDFVPAEAAVLRRQSPQRLREVEEGFLEDVAGLLAGSDDWETPEHLVGEGLQPPLEITQQIIEHPGSSSRSRTSHWSSRVVVWASVCSPRLYGIE